MTATFRERTFLSLLVIPWLWPFTPGPSASVGPLLGAWACFLLAVSLLVWDREPAGLLARALPSSWRIAACVSAVIGLMQFFGTVPSISLISSAQLGEAYGNLRQKNQFATLMGLGFAAFVWRGAAASALRWPAVVLLATANAASASRTGLLEWVVVATLAFAWKPRDRDRLVLCGVALCAYVAASLVLPQALTLLRGEAVPNVFGRAMSELGCSSRRVLWANVLHLIALRPWTGWGLGELDYAHYATLYDGPRFCDILDNAHNLPLHIAVELGIPAALLMVCTIAFCVWRGKPWRTAPQAERLAWTALALIGLHSLLEYPLWYGPFQLAVAFSVWLLVRPRALGAPQRALAAWGCALGLAALAWMASLYDAVGQPYKQPEERRAAYRADPIGAVGDPLVFRAQLRFAELSLADVTPGTAVRVHELALDLLHYSPEPMVVEKLIESALLLGRIDEARWHALRFRAAFPERYRQWRSQSSVAGRLPSAP